MAHWNHSAFSHFALYFNFCFHLNSTHSHVRSSILIALVCSVTLDGTPDVWIDEIRHFKSIYQKIFDNGWFSTEKKYTHRNECHHVDHLHHQKIYVRFPILGSVLKYHVRRSIFIPFETHMDCIPIGNIFKINLKLDFTQIICIKF